MPRLAQVLSKDGRQLRRCSKKPFGELRVHFDSVHLNGYGDCYVVVVAVDVAAVARADGDSNCECCCCDFYAVDVVAKLGTMIVALVC